MTLACRGTSCDPPLRAGLDMFTSSVECTSGFVARSDLDQVLYVFTAGHCLAAAGRAAQWRIQTPTFGARGVGNGWNYVFGGTRGDSAIIRVADTAFWRPRAQVLVLASAGTTSDVSYAVARRGTAIQGARVCKTGALGDTSCGRVLGTEVTVQYSEGTVHGLTEADYCSRAGDSGGPIYSGHVAYGLVSGGAVSGPCDSFFEPILRAQQQLRVHVALGN